MRGSLTRLALDRLGSIDDILVVDRFFSADLVKQVTEVPEFPANFAAAVPAILVEGSVKNVSPDRTASAGQVTILGCDDFAALGSGGPPQAIAAGEIVLNEPLADEIRARVGDEVLLRIGKVDQIPPDSPLGRKTETTRSRRLKVSGIVPAEGLGRFGLRPSQQLPHNAYVAVETLADAIDLADKFNAIFVTGPANLSGAASVAPSAAADASLQDHLRPTLADYGYSLTHTAQGYWQFAGDRLVIEPAAERAVLREFAADQPQPVLTYLANTIRVGSQEIPYSTVSALDFTATPPLGPFQNPAGEPLPPLADGEIALNTWAADDLGAKVGDEVELVYFEPESTHGQVREGAVKFRLAAIVELAGAAADRNLTPEMKGVTDQASISNWDPPFPFDAARVRKKDEKYWDEYRATPKAFVSLATGQRLWSSRFGRATSIRLVARRGRHRCELGREAKAEPAGLWLSFPARAPAGARGGVGHDAVWRAVSGVQLFSDRCGRDAGGDFVSIGRRTASGRVRAAAGRGNLG